MIPKYYAKIPSIFDFIVGFIALYKSIVNENFNREFLDTEFFELVPMIAQKFFLFEKNKKPKCL